MPARFLIFNIYDFTCFIYLFTDKVSACITGNISCWRFSSVLLYIFMHSLTFIVSI
jgi:hypothetical protein